MANNINLQDMPQLVLDKITLFLSHRQLLTLEQVSKKLKIAVNGHFSITDHLILGSLPELKSRTIQVAAEDKECINGLIKLTKYCGSRLRTIQLNVTDRFRSATVIENYIRYTNHMPRNYVIIVLTSNKLSPRRRQTVVGQILNHTRIFDRNKVVLPGHITKKYALQLYTFSTGGTCKLRSIDIC